LADPLEAWLGGPTKRRPVTDQETTPFAETEAPEELLEAEPGTEELTDEDDVTEQAEPISAEDETDAEEDDVEDALDVIVSAWFERSDRDDDGGDDDVDDGPGAGRDGGLAEVIPTRRPGEFLCPSCFLLKPPSQLVDPAAGLCRDCA
jgi:hypothetical protein